MTTQQHQAVYWALTWLFVGAIASASGESRANAAELDFENAATAQLLKL